MAQKPTKSIGQPEIMVAETQIVRDAVVISFPKSILNKVPIENGRAFFCVTNGVLQVSGKVPSAVMPMAVISDEGFMPQGGQG
jgi:hypothetical protein